MSNSSFQTSHENLYASPEFVEKIPIAFARRFLLMGFCDDASRENRVVVHLGDEKSWHVLDAIRRTLGCHITPEISSPDEVLTAINSGYQTHSGM